MHKTKALKLVMLIGCMTALVAVVHYFTKTTYTTEDIIHLITSYKILGPVLFVVIYAVLTAALVPTLPLNIAAGFVWGTLFGTVFSVVAATSGSLIAFYVARYISREYILGKLDGKIWVFIREEIEKNEWKIVAFTRINPIFPFGLVNYFFGALNVRQATYLWCTLLFIVPPSLVFSAIGSSLNEFVISDDITNKINNILLVSFLVTLLIAIKLYFSRYSKKVQA